MNIAKRVIKMSKEANNSLDEKKAKKPVIFVLLIGALIPIFAGILAASIYLFTSPGWISGLVFVLAILMLIILPLILLIIFYQKRLKTKELKKEKKVIILRSENV
jgi:hypothetical protein